MNRWPASVSLAASLAVGVAASPAAAADFVWATASVKATRWVEKDSPEVGEVEPGKRLEVLFSRGERLRVRVQGARFGWIDAAMTTDVEPPKPEGEGSDGGEGGLPGPGGLPIDLFPQE
jgi:hypothetical protein